MGAVEESTYAVTAAFTDHLGVAVVPTSITWSLLDLDGTIIHSRSAVAVAVPAASVDIVLSGDDLVLGADDSGDRILLVEAVYTSSLGSGLPLKKEYRFTIEPLDGVE